MTHTEKLHQPEAQEWFSQHEFWKMIETLTGKAILVNEDYMLDTEAYPGFHEAIQELKKKLPQRMLNAFNDLGVEFINQDRIKWSLVSLLLKGEGWIALWSWWFIRPNVILTAAHVLRNKETGQVRPLYDITDGKGVSYEVEAIYYNKINTEDIGFIVIKGHNSSYIELYSEPESEEVITFGFSNIKPHFLKGKVWKTFLQSVLQEKYRMKWETRDHDNDGKDDFREHTLVSNEMSKGDSWWLALWPEWKLHWIVSKGGNFIGMHSWSSLEPKSKILQQFGDFIRAITKIRVKIK